MANLRPRYDLSHVTTKAEKDGETWKITGHKSVVLGAKAASHLVVSARTSGEADDEAGISLFLVENGSSVNCRDYGTMDGYAASEVYFDQSAAKLLGGKDAGFATVELAHAQRDHCAVRRNAGERWKSRKT